MNTLFIPICCHGQISSDYFEIPVNNSLKFSSDAYCKLVISDNDIQTISTKITSEKTFLSETRKFSNISSGYLCRNVKCFFESKKDKELTVRNIKYYTTPVTKEYEKLLNRIHDMFENITKIIMLDEILYTLNNIIEESVKLEPVKLNIYVFSCLGVPDDLYMTSCYVNYGMLVTYPVGITDSKIKKQIYIK